MNDNIILIDWLSITSRNLDALGFQILIGMTDVPWESISGMHGYKDRLYFNGVSIHFNGRDNMGVWLEMSGQGCRTFESLGNGDYQALFDFVLSGDANITRIDVAYDDHQGVLDMEVLTEATLNQCYVSKSRSWKLELSDSGRTIYHGSAKSDVYIRIYDKAAERQCETGTHWIRVEIQFRRERAKQFIELENSIGDSFAGVLCNYLRYVVPDEMDSNKWRWCLTDYWGELLCGAAAIKLYQKPGIDYNILHCENYVYKQAGNAIDALIQIYGEQVFMERLQERHTRPNPKYTALVDLYKDFDFK